MPLPASVRFVGYATFALGLGVLAATIALRIGSPWPLEWMEGASLQHAIRLLNGQALYAAPSSEFIPFVYPPLAYVPIAAGIRLFGPSLWIGRLVSVLALLGSLACVSTILRRSTRSAAIGCWGAGVYALGFGYTGAFADLVRVDSVFMLLVLLGIERLSAQAIGRGLAWLVLSCLAKQHGVLFLGAAAIALALCTTDSRRTALQLTAAGGTLLAAIAALQVWSSGYFLAYTGSVPAGHGIIPPLLVSYVGVDVLVYLPVLAAFVALGSARATRRSEVRAAATSAGGPPPDVKVRDLGTDSVWGLTVGGTWGRSFTGGESPIIGWALVAAGLLASALGRAHPGGDDNVRMPGFAVLVLGAGAAFPALWSRAASKPARVGCVAGLIVQPLLLLQLPAAYAPAPRTAAQFEALEASLRRCANGELANAVALDHALLTGRPFLHTLALSDLRLSDDSQLAAAATQALVRALTARTAPASIAVSSTFPELEEALRDNYEACDRLPALRLATGYALKATTVYRRRDLTQPRATFANPD